MTNKKVDGRTAEGKALKAAESEATPGEESMNRMSSDDAMRGMLDGQADRDKAELAEFRAQKHVHTQQLADDANMRAERDQQHATDHELGDRNKINNLEYDAVAHDKNKRLDAEYYIKKYPDMHFMWRNRLDGGVEHWISLGAEPQVYEADENVRVFKGLNDRKEDEYVSVPGGADNGVPFDVYLLKMSKVDYYNRIQAPERRRSEEMQRAMGMGAKKGEVHGNARAASPRVNTYAPETITGETGFNQSSGPLDESEFTAIGGAGGFNAITGG